MDFGKVPVSTTATNGSQLPHSCSVLGTPTISSGQGDEERVGHSAFHLRLRRETAPQHEAIERQLDLLDPELSLHRYRLVLESFHGFYAPVESALPPLVATTPALGFPLRPRTELLERDLFSLGLSRSDIAGLPDALTCLACAEPSIWPAVCMSSRARVLADRSSPKLCAAVCPHRRWRALLLRG